MGVTSAPECFPYTIQKALNGLAGVLNMVDDIVVLFVMRRSTRSGCSRSWIDFWSVV